MKLRNKLTGEVVAYRNAEWEEVKGPCEFWYSIMVGLNYKEGRFDYGVVQLDKDLYDSSKAKEIGLYFESKEEADEAIKNMKERAKEEK